MKRDLYQTLIEWKHEQHRFPLLLRGARQTGKSYLVTQFGEKEFDRIITLNFERNPEFKEIFSSNDPEEILERIMLFTGTRPKSGGSLLFLDEIQECPEAITSLRYFYEELPELHVIGAGSLLEFALRSKDIRVPVGRIQYLYLYPLSFGEFLDATGEIELRQHVKRPENLKNLPGGVHNKLIELVKKYYLIGGMPKAVQTYVTTGELSHCQKIQQSILDTYQDDFAKYARESMHGHLKKVFEAASTTVGQRMIYAGIDSQSRSRELKKALELLETAGIVTRVSQTNASGVPLSSGRHHSIFKVIFLDVGLMHAMNNIYPETVRSKDLNAIFRGGVAEQFAGQEIVAYQSPFRRKNLYFWGRQAKNSTAEIDYLVDMDAQVVPVEIKSGPKGHLKSLFMYIEKHRSERAYIVSQAPYKKEGPLYSIPFYAMEAFFRK
ncbi:MAG: AAA family ATPase [Bacteroidales bacterium]